MLQYIYVRSVCEVNLGQVSSYWLRDMAYICFFSMNSAFPFLQYRFQVSEIFDVVSRSDHCSLCVFMTAVVSRSGHCSL